MNGDFPQANTPPSHVFGHSHQLSLKYAATQPQLCMVCGYNLGEKQAHHVTMYPSE